MSEWIHDLLCSKVPSGQGAAESSPAGRARFLKGLAHRAALLSFVRRRPELPPCEMQAIMILRPLAGIEIGAENPFALHGFAIVSDDNCIADAQGRFPDDLKNDADWAYFQAGLDAADLTLLGRRSHEASPNVKRRRRMIMSRSVPALDRREDGIWWNPAGLGLGEALRSVLPAGGHVAVPGGRDMFDQIGPTGFSTFHLARAGGRLLPGGRGLFSACESGMSAEEVLASGGLSPDATVWLDEPAQVSLTVWRRR